MKALITHCVKVYGLGTVDNTSRHHLSLGSWWASMRDLSLPRDETVAWLWWSLPNQWIQDLSSHSSFTLHMMAKNIVWDNCFSKFLLNQIFLIHHFHCAWLVMTFSNYWLLTDLKFSRYKIAQRASDWSFMTLIKISLSLLFTLKTNLFISNPSLQFASEIKNDRAFFGWSTSQRLSCLKEYGLLLMIICPAKMGETITFASF